MSRKTRGRALLIINKHFHHSELEDLENIDVDLINLGQLLLKLHFKLEVEQDATAEVCHFICHQLSSLLRILMLKSTPCCNFRFFT